MKTKLNLNNQAKKPKKAGKLNRLFFIFWQPIKNNQTAINEIYKTIFTFIILTFFVKPN